MQLKQPPFVTGTFFGLPLAFRVDSRLNQIRQYIAENPLNWRRDEENPNVTASP